VTQTGNADIPIPAGVTVKYVGYWNALTGGTFKGAAPLGGTPMEYTVDTVADTVNRTAHGLANGDRGRVPERHGPGRPDGRHRVFRRQRPPPTRSRSRRPAAARPST
jgi:hypothetical protein